MSTGYQIKDQKGLYFLTFQVINWIDIFSRDIYRDIVLDSFGLCNEKQRPSIICLCNNVQSCASGCQ